MVVVRLEDLLEVDQLASASLLVTFDDVSNLRRDYEKFWAIVLLIALRDKAVSVHYHPWCDVGALTYVVDRKQFEIVSPPAEYAGMCLDVARTLFTQPKRSGFVSRFWRRRPENSISSAVQVEGEGQTTFWDAVCWSSGERAGVELFLIAPLHQSDV